VGGRRCGALAIRFALFVTIELAPPAGGVGVSLAQPTGALTDSLAVDSLSVEECVALARRQAPEVRSLAFSREAARLDSIALALNGRPAFSIFGGTTIAPKGFYDPAATNLGEYELKAGLELPLRDGGGRRRERMRGALNAQNALIESARASRDAGLRAAEVALDVLRSREQAGALTETVEWLGRLDLLVGSGVRAGSRDRSDAERVAIESDAVRSDLESLRQSESTLGRELAELTGHAAGVLVSRDQGGEDERVAPDSLALLHRATQAPEVRTARVTEMQQQLALDEARRKNAWTIDLAADAGAWGTDLTRAVPPDLAAEHPGAGFGDRLRRDLGASVALRFKRPVLDPSAAYAISARERDLRAAEAKSVAAQLERARAALDAMTRSRTATRRLALADSSVARAEAHLLRLRSLYAAGASTLLELLDARRQLDDARGRRADATMERRLAHWQEVLQ